jgi:acyl-CoA thioesterase-2
MDQKVRELIELLSLERLEDNLFRGPSRDIGTTRVFGGQVLGQAIRAAQSTVESRVVHSLHAYFLREGDHTAPIIYDVDRSRDGGSFSARRVVAIQHGRPIFTLAASFQRPEEGLDHFAAMPAVVAPEAVAGIASSPAEIAAQLPEKILRVLKTPAAPFDLRPIEPIVVVNPEPGEPRRHMWLRIPERLPDDDMLHRALLAYVSDYGLLATALVPHGVHLFDHTLQMASLDHAMWYHRPFRMDEWLLYACDSPSASGARGLARGAFYRRDGTLVASTAQEGLLRQRS